MKRLYVVFSLLAALFCSSCADNPQIITTVDKVADGQWQCFTKEFVLLAPKSAELRIAADTKYWLFVNGELVVREGGLKRGPTPTDSYCDVLSEVPNLKFGKNRVVVLVQYYGRNSFSHRPSACPGISFDLDTKLGRVVSDKSWKAIRYDAFWAPADENPKGPRQYRLAGANVGYDARKAIDFWVDDFDDSGWNNAVEVAAKDAEWGAFVERPIPQWRWGELVDYQSVTYKEDGVIECALPYNAHVTPYIRLKAKGGELAKTR